MSEEGVSLNDVSIGDLRDNLVVIAVDKSQQAEDAFDAYFNHLYRPDHQVVLVNVPQEPTTHTCQEGTNMRDSDWEKMQRHEQEDTAEIVSIFSAKCKERKMKVCYKTVYSVKPEQAIVGAANEMAAMLLVVGCHEKGVVRRTLLGSVSDYILENAKMSVFVCRKGE